MWTSYLMHILGPTELSIASPEAVRAIYGSHSPVTKGPWYTLLEPRTPLFMARDKQEHARRRKVWDRGFSTKGKPPDLLAVTICTHRQSDRTKRSLDTSRASQKQSISCCQSSTNREKSHSIFHDGLTSWFLMSWKISPSTRRQTCLETVKSPMFLKQSGWTCFILHLWRICHGS